MSKKNIENQRSNFSIAILILSAAIYLTCLSFDSFCVNGNCSGWPGYSVLIFGWVEPLIWWSNLSVIFAAFTWLANPLLIMSWTFNILGKRNLSLQLGVTGMLLSFSFLLAREVLVSESGSPGAITGYGLGYWLWLLSIFLACISSFLLRNPNRQKLPTP